MAQQKIWESYSVAISHLLHLVELLLPAEVLPVVSLLGSVGKCRKNARTSKYLPSKTHLIGTFQNDQWHVGKVCISMPCRLTNMNQSCIAA